MDFNFSEDQEALRELARKIFEDCASHERLKEVEASEERVGRELWRELAKANLLGVPLAEAHGGSGLGPFELGILLEEAGRATAPIPLLPTLGAALPVQEFGSDAQRERFLPRVAQGDVMLSTALQEAGVPDAAAPSTRARRDGTDHRLEGSKLLVPAFHVAERVLLAARSDEGVGIFLLDPGASGIQALRQQTTTGEPRFDLELDGVRVEAADVLGDPAQGAAIARWTQQRCVTGLCAQLLGVTEGALQMTARYTTERRQFDRPIGSFQAVHQRAADAYIDIEAIRLTLWQVLHRLAQGEEVEEALAVAKFWASEAGARVTYAAQHLHGGIGVDMDYPLHRYYTWARDLALTLGSATEQIAALGERLAAD